jgi:hypothetical protein
MSLRDEPHHPRRHRDQVGATPRGPVCSTGAYRRIAADDQRDACLRAVACELVHDIDVQRSNAHRAHAKAGEQPEQARHDGPLTRAPRKSRDDRDRRQAHDRPGHRKLSRGHSERTGPRRDTGHDQPQVGAPRQ